MFAVSKKVQVQFLLYFLLIISFWLIAWGTKDLTLSHAQAYFLPFLLLILASLKVFNRGKVFLLLTLVFIFSIGIHFLVTYRHMLNGKALMIAKIKGDDFEQETRIFREKINHQLHEKNLKESLTLSKSFYDTKSVELFLKEHPDIKAVIWGSDYWLTFSQLIKPPFRLSDFNLTRELPADLVFLGNIPHIGLSYQPTGATINFLANLVSGKGDFSDSVMEKQEIDLIATSQILSTWSKDTHRAYPWFLVGNLYLKKLLSGDVYQAALLNCVFDAYANASSHIMKDHNPELTAALNNNIAVAYFVRFVFEGDKNRLKKAKARLRSAYKSFNLPNPYKVNYLSPYLAKLNLQTLELFAN